jgi:hypothetical protein
VDVLQKLGSVPIKAVAMADGGMALVLMARPFYSAIEIYNDGEAVVSFSDRKQRHLAWDVTLEDASLKVAMERLRDLMHGRGPGPTAAPGPSSGPALLAVRASLSRNSSDSLG